MSMKSSQKLKWHLGFKAHYSHIRVMVRETDLHQFMNFMLLTATYQGNFKLINCHHPVMDIILLSCTFVNHNERYRPKASSTKKLLSTQKQQRKERLCLVKIAVGTCSYIVYIFRHLLIIPPPPPKVLFFIDSYHQYLKTAMHCKVVRA